MLSKLDRVGIINLLLVAVTYVAILLAIVGTFYTLNAYEEFTAEEAPVEVTIQPAIQ